ncbi:exported hypothetical protein [Candidatus Sulfopaludibacter sp. SbA3]|nr:exported hypothetical protein [Candidatus Sulfopaludibacter sp. SbA3]
MRKAFAERPLILVLCVALLSLLVLNPAGSHVWVELVPALILFATPLVLMAKRPRRPQVQSQPLSFLSLDISRAPPIA